MYIKYDECQLIINGQVRDLYDNSELARKIFEEANKVLGFSITEIMFLGNEESLKQTKVTQPAIFLYSVILAKLLGNSFKPDMVAGHSLGEFSALVASKYLSFKDGLKLVSKRAVAMQKACEKNPSTMAAIIGMEDHVIESICEEIKEIVVPANYNSPGQLVISGSIKGIDIACEKLQIAGAKRAIKLPVGGAFHSPLMEPARNELERAIDQTNFTKGVCPIYQNVTTHATNNPDLIKNNLKKQLTSAVLWTQNMRQMINDGASSIIEVGPGKVLQGLFKKLDRSLETNSATL